MSTRIDVSTQEVGTGRWFVVTSYRPVSRVQMRRAEELAYGLRALGLYVKTEELDA